MGTPNEIIYTLEVQLSFNSFSHERHVYALLDMVGDIGGLTDATVLIFSALMGSYSPNLLGRSIIEAVFRVDTQSYEPQNERRKRRRRQSNANRSPESQLKQALKTSAQPQRTTVPLVGDNFTAILNKLKRLKKLKISWWTALFVNKCNCLRRILRSEIKRKEKLFEKGMTRIESALDIRSLLRMQVENRIIIQRLFSARQRMALRLQRVQALHLEEMSPDEESGSGSAIPRQQVDKGGSGKVNLDKVASLMMGWQVRTKLDRQLILGLVQDEADMERYKPP